MAIATAIKGGSIPVLDYRCTAGPADRPFPELHEAFSISYVRSGSFGYLHRGRSFELVAGCVLTGFPGDEFMCTHDHACGGDECLSFRFTPEVIDTVGAQRKVWQAGALPPVAELIVLGERAQAAAETTCELGLEETGLRSMPASTICPISCARSTAPRGCRRGAFGRPRNGIARFSKNACVEARSMALPQRRFPCTITSV